MKKYPNLVAYFLKNKINSNPAEFLMYQMQRPQVTNSLASAQGHIAIYIYIYINIMLFDLTMTQLNISLFNCRRECGKIIRKVKFTNSQYFMFLHLPLKKNS